MIRRTPLALEQADKFVSMGDSEASPEQLESIREIYSLALAARMICGPDGAGIKDPERWVVRRIRAGRFTGRKIGCMYRMTLQDMEDALEVCRCGAPLQPPIVTCFGHPSEKTLLTGAASRAEYC